MLISIIFSTSFFQTEYLSVINYLSSIVKWDYQDNFKPVYFFLKEKVSRAQKHVTPRSLCAREKLLS